MSKIRIVIASGLIAATIAGTVVHEVSRPQPSHPVAGAITCC
jgi:hypothetical protein